MAADDESSGLILKLIICLIAAASAAVVVTVYHCITVKHTTARRPHQRRRDPAPPETTTYDLETMSMENSVAELLPARKFEKGAEDCPCAICLCEFEDGEELRTLPECAHSFHAPCIDMWLYSHTNCPVCRRAVVGLEEYSSTTLMHLLHT